MDYDEPSDELHLKGRVWVKESTWTLKGDELWLDTETRVGRSQGFLLVEDGQSALYGDSGTFDFAGHSGVLYGAHAGHGDWRVHAKSVRLHESRRVDYRTARFTSCSYDPRPHYHFRASRVTVVPKKHIVAYNARFYLGRVPLFYTPVLYKSLKPRHLIRWRVQPGFDKRNGFFARGTLTTDHGPYVYSKLFADYYLRQGFGYGGELHRRRGEDSRGAVYGYRIEEKHNGLERWALLGDAYQALPSSFSFQGRLQAQSDSHFNNHYARASHFRVTEELINSAAVTHRTDKVTTRLSYSRRDVAATPSRYVVESESYPRLDLQTVPFKVWRLPWLNSLTAFGEQNVVRGRSFIQRSAGAEWEATRTFVVRRGVSFQPKAAYGQTYLNRFERPLASTRTYVDAFVGRYRLEGTLRLGSVDLTHLFTRRQRPDSLADDAAAADYGVERNLLLGQETFRPSRTTLVRLQSGYDWRRFRDRKVGTQERVQPITGELAYTPRPTLNVTLRDEYRLDSGNSAVIADARWGREEETFLAVGFSYNKARPDDYVGSTEFSVANASNTLRVGGALRGLAVSEGGVDKLTGLRLFEKELFVVRRFHDFYGKLLGRLRPGGVKEVQVRLDIKLPAFSREQERRRDWEAEWFPERRRQDADRF